MRPSPLPPQPAQAAQRLVAYFRQDDTLRSRSVGDRLLWGTLDVPPPPARLQADWEREVSQQLGLEAGDVEPLPLARARARWPDYRHCVQAMADWLQRQGLPELLPAADVALMACRGARYHHDGAHYGGAAFCNLFVSEDKNLDVHFPGTGHRIALTRGTVLLFDTGQPHAVIRRGSDGFDTADFAAGRDVTQVFLTWELPIAQADVARALGIEFDIDPSTAARLDEEQVWANGAPASVCPASGRWRHGDDTPS